MQEQGIVVSLSGDTAFVKMKRASACGENCGSCSGCNNFRTVTAENKLRASVGDNVEISMPSDRVLFAAMLVYVIPIAVLIVGYFAAYGVLHSENAGVLFGIIGMIISYIFAVIFTKKNKNRYKSSITKIL